jgi:hypothetical protein
VLVRSAELHRKLGWVQGLVWLFASQQECVSLTLESDVISKRRESAQSEWSHWNLWKDKAPECSMSINCTDVQCLIMKSTIQSGWLLAFTSIAYLIGVFRLKNQTL